MGIKSQEPFLRRQNPPLPAYNKPIQVYYHIEEPVRRLLYKTTSVRIKNRNYRNMIHITPNKLNHNESLIKGTPFFFCFLLLSVFIQAQTSKQEFYAKPEFASGIYKPYSYVSIEATPAPKGYEPFYISHYGRHGSRWLTSSRFYEKPAELLRQAYNDGKLTALGENVYSWVKILEEDARGRYGALSRLGTNEHKGIAERMFHSFPDIFSTENNRKCFIYSRSTKSTRCVLSMAASNERLKELNPEIEIIREAVDRNEYLNNKINYRPGIKDSVSMVVRNFFYEHFDPDRFLSSVFTDPSYPGAQSEDIYSFTMDLYALVAIMPDMDHLDISIPNIFSKEELFILWQTTNLKMYFNYGPSFINGKDAENSAIPLLRNILDCADYAIEHGNISADLRFGHDVYMIPLLAIMDIEGMNQQESDPEKVYQSWSNFKVSPMAANIQMVFYRNKKKGNDILVKFLHCEKEVGIPVPTDNFPYFSWKEVKAYYEEKINRYTSII
jgi:hypothetical protein